MSLILYRVEKFITKRLKPKNIIYCLLKKCNSMIHGAISFPEYKGEIGFWENWIPKTWKQISKKESWEKIFPKALAEHINDFRKVNNNTVRILEVGSGPASLLAWSVHKNLCEIVAVDPLAKEYKRILDKYNYIYPIKPIVGKGESLLKLFKENYF